MTWENEFTDRREAGTDLAWGLTTLLVGVALGAVAVLLMLPKSGSELRARAEGIAGSWKEHAAETLAQGRERVVNAVEQAQGRAEPPVDHPAIVKSA